MDEPRHENGSDSVPSVSLEGWVILHIMLLVSLLVVLLLALRYDPISRPNIRGCYPCSHPSTTHHLAATLRSGGGEIRWPRVKDTILSNRQRCVPFPRTNSSTPSSVGGICLSRRNRFSMVSKQRNCNMIAGSKLGLNFYLFSRRKNSGGNYFSFRSSQLAEAPTAVWFMSEYSTDSPSCIDIY